MHYENLIIKPQKNAKNYKLDLEDKIIPFGESGIFVGIETIQQEHIELTNSMYLTTPSILHTHSVKQLKYTPFH
ncbi:hypothetical protein [Winogradskyella sp. PC D3.3]